jgi:Tol biopolymer transport system component
VPAPGATTTATTAAARNSTVTAARASRAQPDATLPPRKAYSGNPDYAAVQLSPDGKYLSYLAPLDGVMNVWVAPLEAPARAEPLTRSRERPIRQYFWAEDDRHLRFLQDAGGDEDVHLYKVDVRARTPPAADLFKRSCTMRSDWPCSKKDGPVGDRSDTTSPRPYVTRA